MHTKLLPIYISKKLYSFSSNLIENKNLNRKKINKLRKVEQFFSLNKNSSMTTHGPIVFWKTRIKLATRLISNSIPNLRLQANLKKMIIQY